MRNPIHVLKSLEEKASVSNYKYERLYRNLTREVISKRRLENKQADDIYLRSMNNGLWCDVTDKK